MTRIKDFLTDEEIEAAIALYKRAEPGTFARQCCETIIRPNIKRINAALGQENYPRYLAYMVEYALMRSSE